MLKTFIEIAVAFLVATGAIVVIVVVVDLIEMWTWFHIRSKKKLFRADEKDKRS